MHYQFKSYSDFNNWTDFAYCRSCMGKVLRSRLVSIQPIFKTSLCVECNYIASFQTWSSEVSNPPWLWHILAPAGSFSLTHCSTVFTTIVYCTVHCTALFCAGLHCTVLHSTALYYTVLFSTVLYCALCNTLYVIALLQCIIQ